LSDSDEVLVTAVIRRPGFLLAVVGLEVTTVEQVRRDRGREFQILGAATLKLREANDVRTNGTERRLVLDSQRERVE